MDSETCQNRYPPPNVQVSPFENADRGDNGAIIPPNATVVPAAFHPSSAPPFYGSPEQEPSAAGPYPFLGATIHQSDYPVEIGGGGGSAVPETYYPTPETFSQHYNQPGLNFGSLPFEGETSIKHWNRHPAIYGSMPDDQQQNRLYTSVLEESQHGASCYLPTANFGPGVAQGSDYPYNIFFHQSAPSNVPVVTKRRGGGRKPKVEKNLTPDEERKRALRRNRNKEAARRCRERRITQMNDLTEENKDLHQKKAELEQTVFLLRMERESILRALEEHKLTCPCGPIDIGLSGVHTSFSQVTSSNQLQVSTVERPSPPNSSSTEVSPNLQEESKPEVEYTFGTVTSSADLPTIPSGSGASQSSDASVDSGPEGRCSLVATEPIPRIFTTLANAFTSMRSSELGIRPETEDYPTISEYQGL